MKKTLALVSKGLEQPDLDELLRKEAMDQCPRASLFATTLQSDILDERFLQTVPLIRRLVYKLLPIYIAQVLEAYWIRKNYDAVITWSEKLSLLFALLLKLTGSRTPLVCMMSWVAKPKLGIPLKLLYSHMDRIILWSSVHLDYALNVLKIPPSKIEFIRFYVDQQFYRPMETEMDMICSAGAEMRDYPTLIEALRRLNIRCHLAAGKSRGQLFDTVKAIYECGPLPDHITAGKMSSLAELRGLYARSFFVVIPLLPPKTDNRLKRWPLFSTRADNGVTAILEAMAMGKAVIASLVERQGDIIQDGKTGILVPPGDPAALCEAIQTLWEQPERAKQIGQAGRQFIEENHNLDRFMDRLRDVVEIVVAERMAGPGVSSAMN